MKENSKLKLYAWPTPYGIKILTLVEELKLPYHLTLIDPSKPPEQDPGYAKLSPQRKLPLLIDEVKGNKKQQHPSVMLWDSGAMLLYLAEKHGQFVPKRLADRAQVFQWLMYAENTISPTLGHVFYYRKMAKEKNQETIDRYTNESLRFLQTLELHLRDNAYLAGDYSIADMAAFPWIKALERLEFNIEKLENLCRWRDMINHRPAVEKAFKVFKEKAVA